MRAETEKNVAEIEQVLSLLTEASLTGIQQKPGSTI